MPVKGKYVKKDNPPRECRVCSSTFKPFRMDNVYCSNSCRYKAQSQKPEQKTKRAEKHKKWSLKNEDWKRNYNYLYTYGITLEKYNELKAAQDHKCAVCHKHESELSRRMAVDHDHKTGEIFGLLCTYCNRQLIGRIRNPELFLRAAQYLSKGTGLFVPEKKKKKRKKRVRRNRS